LDKINIRMKILFLIIVLIINIMKADNINLNTDFIEKDVITNEMIEKSGLFRIGDLLLLANKIKVSSIDGFTWFSSINGLSTFQKQSWIVLLDGEKLGVNTLNIVDINMLPIHITQIDSVEIITVPQLYEGIFSESGLIHIYTKNIADGKLLTISQSAANETGDTGPYEKTIYETPNVEIVSASSEITLDYNFDKSNIKTGFNYQGYSLTDWAIRDRNLNIHGFENNNDGSDHFIIPELTPNPSIEKNSVFFKFKTITDNSEHQFFTSYSNSNKHFFFLKQIGREIPVKYLIKYAGYKNKIIFSEKYIISTRLHYSTSELNKYPNELGFDFDWKSTNLHSNIENQFTIFSYNGKFGIGFDRYSLNTKYKLNKSFYDIYNLYGSFHYNLKENLIQNIDAMILLSNRKYALKGTCVTKWVLNRNNILKAITSYTERLLEEDNGLWYWSELGYGLIDTEYTIKGNFNKSKTVTTDIIWENKISDKLTIDISNYYRSFYDIYLEQQHYSFNLEDGSFHSSPLIIHTNQDGKVIGINLTIKSDINTKTNQYFYYDYQAEISSKDAFKDVMRTIPKHSLDYQLIFSPIRNFSIWTKFSYISSAKWRNYNNVSGESYLTVHQNTLKYSNVVGSSNFVDIGFQKWFFKRKINTNLFFRNIFNQKKLYHPIGASFDLTLYFHITYYPLKNNYL